MSRDPAEAHDDSAKCYELALAAIREREIRAGNIQPSADRPDEIRWASEGMIEKLETVSRG